MRRTRYLAALLATAVAGAACGGSSRPPAGVSVAARSGTAYQLVADRTGTAIADPGDTAKVASAEEAFSFDLLRNLSAGPGNVTVSPFSLATALAMLENGASGTTQAGIARTLDTSTLTPADQDAGWLGLTPA